MGDCGGDKVTFGFTLHSLVIGHQSLFCRLTWKNLWWQGNWVFLWSDKISYALLARLVCLNYGWVWEWKFTNKCFPKEMYLDHEAWGWILQLIVWLILFSQVGSQCTILTDNFCEDAYDLLQNPVLKKILVSCNDINS